MLQKENEGHPCICTGDKNVTLLDSASLCLDQVTGTVEQFVLSCYAQQGWKGVFAENALFRAIWTCFMGPEMVSPWHNSRTCLESISPWYYILNKKIIEEKLSKLPSLLCAKKDFELQTIVHKTIAYASTKLSQWHTMHQIKHEDLVSIIRAMGPSIISDILLILALHGEPYTRGSPDLFLWREETKQILWLEVKANNDRLNSWQRVWLRELDSICRRHSSPRLQAFVGVQIVKSKDMMQWAGRQ